MTVLKLASKSWSYLIVGSCLPVAPHLNWVILRWRDHTKAQILKIQGVSCLPWFFPIKFICCGVLKPGFYNPPKIWFKCGIIRQMVECKWMNLWCINWRALFIIMWDCVRCESNSMCCAVVFIQALYSFILLFLFVCLFMGHPTIIFILEADWECLHWTAKATSFRKKEYPCLSSFLVHRTPFDWYSVNIY